MKINKRVGFAGEHLVNKRCRFNVSNSSIFVKIYNTSFDIEPLDPCRTQITKSHKSSPKPKLIDKLIMS